ncbi:MAG: SDR family oxidoreductase [Bacteroidaceae bacterium]|nr:SDR family oxidoreductase [Bacteroidaceae bacterium]
MVANITDRALIESLKDEVIGKFGQLDGLINNAGIIQKFSALADTPYAEIERVMNINFYGTLYVLKTFLPYLLQRPEAHVVNVASMGSFLPVPGQVTYGASKAAVKLMTEGLMCELADTHCQVSVVFPGSIATNIQKNSGASNVEISREVIEQHKGILLTMPEDAAETIVHGMERGKKRIKIGHDCKAMDKLTRLAPNLAGKLITKAMKGKIELE